MKWGHAFFAGVIGGATMTTIMAVARMTGMKFHFEMILGTVLGGQPGMMRWTIGLVMHLALAGVTALLYAFAFEHAVNRAGWFVGAALSPIHALIAGLGLEFAPALSPLVPEMMDDPGPFMSNYGSAHMVFFVLLHVAYGVIVGVMYGPVRNSVQRG